MACFVAPGEVACIWTEDPESPFYQAAQDAFRTLSQATDAKGRRLTVHKLCLTQKPCCLEGAETIDAVEGTVPRENGEVSIASYMNFLIVNGAVIAPQYGDENDQLAIQQLQQEKSRERFSAPGILCNLFGYTSGRNDQMMFRVTLSVDFRLL